ncbi:MAG TPA: hypothetical protein VGY30_01075 [Solirubrobacteraceae bacterium]|jgi:hypothetical protein|nr:hypothetical protein [Solirubrobacteraceae bacterium]
MEQLDAHVPAPGSDRGAWWAATALGLLGLVVLALALSGIVGGSSSQSALPPAVLAVAATPTPASETNAPAATASGLGAATVAGHRAIVGGAGGTLSSEAQRDLAVYLDPTSVHIPERWMAGFYPIYATAQRTFGVNWLLIASIHRQESAFSTAPGIYQGLNFAGCCGGPMQFNVTNGPRTTWSLVSDSYRYGARPASYDHMIARHPSIYDDFDSIMAAAHLLSADGAGAQLDGSAWSAAYDYYGHDATGVTYADQVLARAISWSQHGFCVNCGVPQAMVEAVHAAYGAPVAASLEAEARAESRSRPGVAPGRGTGKGTASKPRRPGRSARRPPGR